MTPQQRTDEHRWSVADPAEYLEVGYFDAHPEEGGSWIDHEAYSEHGATVGDSFVGNYERRGRCDHCGAGPLRYGVVFLHLPTLKEVVVGTQCAGRLGLATRSELEHGQLIAQARRENRLRIFLAEPLNRDALSYVEQRVDAGDYGFFHDLQGKLKQYGYLTENQVAAVLRSKQRDEERIAQRRAEDAAAGPFVEGRRLVEGRIISIKWKDSDFGGAWKMTVAEDDGNKVWGTCPSSLIDPTYYDAEGNYRGDDGPPTLKGQRVRFTATIERGREEHFGFFKRPTKAELVVGELLTPIEEMR